MPLVHEDAIKRYFADIDLDAQAYLGRDNIKRRLLHSEAMVTESLKRLGYLLPEYPTNVSPVAKDLLELMIVEPVAAEIFTAVGAVSDVIYIKTAQSFLRRAELLKKFFDSGEFNESLSLLGPSLQFAEVTDVSLIIPGYGINADTIEEDGWILALIRQFSAVIGSVLIRRGVSLAHPMTSVVRGLVNEITVGWTVAVRLRGRAFMNYGNTNLPPTLDPQAAFYEDRATKRFIGLWGGADDQVLYATG